MAKKIRNWTDFQRIVENKIQATLQQTRDIVATCLQDSLDDYYKESVFSGGTSNQPAIYNRTYALLNSMVKTDIVRQGNSFHCEVKIDESYLQNTYSNSDTTGLDVLLANETDGTHGTTPEWAVQGEHRIWQEAIRNIQDEGGILFIFKEKLKKQGVHIV